MVKRDYYREKRDKALEILGNKCNTCGSTDNLEIDHIDWRLKTLDMARQWCSDLYFEELKKCQLLCNSCHIAKSKIDKEERAEELELSFTHGTLYGATKKNCKCDACINLLEEHNKLRREKRFSTHRGPYGLPAEHGTYTRYKRGCKCPECRKANCKQTAYYKRKKKNK
jgi:hypothetical protein